MPTNEVEISGEGSAVGTLFTVDCAGYESIAVHHFSAAFAGSVSCFHSNDGVNWQSAAGQDVGGTASIGTGPAWLGPEVFSGAVNRIRIYPVIARYFQCRIQAYTSGSLKTMGFLKNAMMLPAINAYITGSATSGAPSGGATNPGTIAQRIVSAAGTNLTNVKSSAGNVYGLILSNTSAAAKFFKLYSKASAPVLASDVPRLTVLVPANSTIDLPFPVPLWMTPGISYAITGLVADTDATATAANDVTGLMNYA